MPENISLKKEKATLSDMEQRELAQRMSEQIPVPTDYTEKLFLDIAVQQHLLVSESERIMLDREKRGKGDKRVTIPDFVIKESPDDEGIYIEVTERNPHDAHKNRQRKVVLEAGLGSRYVQMTASELEQIQKEGTSLMRYIREKISSQG